MDQTLLLAVAIVAAAMLIVLALTVGLLVDMRRKLAMQMLREQDGQQRSLLEKNAELELTASLLRANREEQANSLARFEETISRSLADNRDALIGQLTQTREAVDRQLTQNRETIERRLQLLQEGNESRLEQMRQTVDEKLTQTVEQRFADSFKLISERLEQVHRGLGEMQQLAGGVDDLRRVLSGVKTRGNLGEYQLGAILEQVLAPEQYLSNVAVKVRSQERVEFAIRLPAKHLDADDLLLPIDSKFPIEDYERLLNAYEGTGEEPLAVVSARLSRSIKTFARGIRDKYINPPKTTDFAIMFVPTEGLYAEILRMPGLFEDLQRSCRVTVVGPTNLAAFLSSLQMGFRTLAIEKRSSEVWQLLGAIKTEFGRFDGLLESVRKKLDAASHEMEKVSSKTRNITRRLGKVQELPQTESIALLVEGQDDEGSDTSAQLGLG
ncbi:MAG: DNA recombination protein RmuC [Coriobacteriales bacterium]|jgi:DNA recombination protein RmuC|nr:DNA recombination protein RmuC [Coriobacteriales bacterium]